MTTYTLKTALFAGALLIGSSGAALAQADADDHDAHHPDEQTTPEAGANGDGAAPDGMSGMMESMTPEMMQMMMQMMREGGMGSMMADGPMGDGSMDDDMGAMMDGPMRDGMMPGRGDMPGRMGEGMGPGMMGGMMSGMMGDRPMMQGHRGMRGQGIGPGALYGIPRDSVTEMTPARVETHLSDLLERHDNPRLELGEITEAEDGSIIAEIVTVDGSLVQRLAFNRYPGVVRQID